MLFWKKTRDLVIETCTIVKGIEAKVDKIEDDFKAHVDDGIERYGAISLLIRECAESCPESGNLKKHSDEQQESLARIEKANNAFYKKHDAIEHTLEAMKTAKKTKKELFAEAGKVIIIVCLVLGAYFAYARYNNAKKPDNTKIEVMLEKILNK
jgi:predicted RNA-binding protein with RPS1 domain